MATDASGKLGWLDEPTPLEYGKQQLQNDLRNMSSENSEALLKDLYSDLEKSTIYDSQGNPIQIQEHGGWIVKNPDGTIGYERVPPGPVNNIGDIGEGGVIGMTFPPDPPSKAIGTFHTHPWAGPKSGCKMGLSSRNCKMDRALRT